MTTAEFKKSVEEHKEKEFLNNVEETFEFPTAKFSKKIKGVVQLHRFYLQQIKGWKKHFGNSENSFNDQNLKHFEKRLESLEAIIDEEDDRNSLYGFYDTTEEKWRKHFNYYGGSKGVFTFAAPEVEFFQGLAEKYPDSVPDALSYFKHDQIELSNRDNMIGTMLAYEYDLGDTSFIHRRKEGEQKAFDELRQSLHDTESALKNEVDLLVGNAEARIDLNQEQFENQSKNQGDVYTNWLDSVKKAVGDFYEDTEKRRGELEKSYQELLRLKKPAEYWKERGEKLNKEGWKAIYGLGGLVVLACVTLYLLLWLTPQGMLLSFVKDSALALKWSVVYVTFISFLAFGIRALNKVAFSAFHLARDAQERHQLTHVYLALVAEKDTDIKDEDRQLILQSLFSRSDSGLLKQDTSPTMPGNLVEKILKSTK